MSRRDLNKFLLKFFLTLGAKRLRGKSFLNTLCLFRKTITRAIFAKKKHHPYGWCCDVVDLSADLSFSGRME
jgi:hypothetical protein